MTKTSVEELVKAVRLRYVRASRDEKTCMLDEFVAVTGYHRKAAIRRLRGRRRRKSNKRQGRPPVYTPEVVAALWEVWEICGRICSKRLAPFLAEAVIVLEREGEVRFPVEIRGRLVTMSPATIDRLLKTHRADQRKGRCTTKPGTLLRSQIPVRTFADWADAVPGFLEIDLVAHCGETTAGEFVHTLTAVDVSTGWCEPVALKNRSQETVQQALEQTQAQLPFPLLGIDSDNDSAFLNWSVKEYCDTNQITFTRCRPYKKNDQAHVEQKNWAVVRQLIGYDRYEGAEACAVLQTIYDDYRVYVNFFQPVRKLVEKRSVNGKTRRRYDTAQTPYRRVLASAGVCEARKRELNRQYATLPPLCLRRRIDENLRRLWKLRRSPSL
jgi:hypothetical protein